MEQKMAQSNNNKLSLDRNENHVTTIICIEIRIFVFLKS